MGQVRLALVFLLVLFAYASGVTLSDANEMIVDSGLQRNVLETQDVSNANEMFNLWAFGKTPYELDNEKSVQFMNKRGIGTGFLYEQNNDIKLYTASHTIIPYNKDTVNICDREIDYRGSISTKVSSIDARGIGIIDLEKTEVTKYDNDVAKIDIDDDRVDREKFKVWNSTSYPVEGNKISLVGYPTDEAKVSNSGMEIVKNCKDHMIAKMNGLRSKSAYTLSGMSGSPVYTQGVAGVFTSASEDYIFVSKLP